jgi:hypothetical protein
MCDASDDVASMLQTVACGGRRQRLHAAARACFGREAKEGRGAGCDAMRCDAGIAEQHAVGLPLL